MNLPGKHWLRIIAIACACLVAVRDLCAALSLTTTSNSVAIPILFTDYNTSTGAAQVIKTSAHSMTVFADKSSWTVSVRTLSNTFSFSPSLGDTNPNKPASDLAIRVPVLSATWIPLSSSSQVLATGDKSNSDQTGSLDYRINSNLSNNPPGNYAISVIYTLTTP